MFMLKSIVRTLVCVSMFLGPWWSAQASDTPQARKVIDTVMAGEVAKSQQSLNRHYVAHTALNASQAQLQQLAIKIVESQQPDLPPLKRALLSNMVQKLVPLVYEYTQNEVNQDVQREWVQRLQAVGFDLNTPTNARQLAQGLKLAMAQLDANDPMAQWLDNASQHIAAQHNPAMDEAERALYSLSGTKFDDGLMTSHTFEMGDPAVLNDFVLAGYDIQGASAEGAGIWYVLIGLLCLFFILTGLGAC